MNEKIDAVDGRITSNHIDAERHWDRIEAEQRTLKHDQRGMEQKIYGLGEGQRRMSAKLKPLEEVPDKIDAVDRRVAAVEVVNAQVEKLTERLGSIEKMAQRIAGIAAAVSVACSIIGAVLLHFSSDLVHWLTGKP